MKNYYWLLPVWLLALSSCQKDSANSPGPGTGTGGSLARFTIAANHLYIVNNNSLAVYNVSTSDNPMKTATLPLTIGVETIFPYKNNLFIGTQTGMYIYGLANPAQPQQLSFFQHVQSCDPVVAQGNYAYVTLRSGSPCRNNNFNSLDIVDITNLSQPKLVKSYPMQSPHGLGIDGSLLFVTEGDNGLKVLDVSDPINMKTVHFFKDVRSFDVIPHNNILIVTGKEGILQYRYQEGGLLADGTQKEPTINLLSKLPIE
jgi:hypothetical protein